MRAVTTAEFWDDQADDFDEQPDHGLRDPAIRSAWVNLVLPLLPPSPARVADLGCGTGSLSVLMAQAGHDVCGLDISPAMVTSAQDKADQAGVDTEFLVGDAAMPPWRQGMFDVVLTRHVLWAMDDPDAALAGWIDLLGPQGHLILIEGRWWTGAGMSAADVTDLVRRHRMEAEVITLDDPVLWGGPIRDERFAVIGRR